MPSVSLEMWLTPRSSVSFLTPGHRTRGINTANPVCRPILCTPTVCLQGVTEHLVLTIILENLRSIPTVHNRGRPASKFQRGQPNFLRPHSKPGQVLASRGKEFPPIRKV